MTTLCLVADTHCHHRELVIPECDILVHCGDYCSFERADHVTLSDVDRWFAEVPAKRVVCIAGNHDFALQRDEFRFANATYLEDSSAEIDGISFYGSPWCPELTGYAYFAETEALAETWKRIPTGVDVLITHTPPNGILDLPSHEPRHLGCAELRIELLRIQPRLHVFGHVHASRGTRTLGATQFVNAAVTGGRFLELRHGPMIVNLGPK